MVEKVGFFQAFRAEIQHPPAQDAKTSAFARTLYGETSTLQSHPPFRVSSVLTRVQGILQSALSSVHVFLRDLEIFTELPDPEHGIRSLPPNTLAPL